MPEALQDHYDRLASVYDNLWFYSGDFVEFLSDEMASYLDLRSDDALLDLGCGTGIYAKALKDVVSLDHDILCVDYSKKMLSKVPEGNGFDPIHMDALSFSREAMRYDKVLVKELIHHIDEANRDELLANLYSNLRSPGRLLLLMLPPSIDYPLFEDALQRYEEAQPHYDPLAERFAAAGFDVSVDFVEYPLVIAKDKYLEMVQKRYMSLLSEFSDAEIEDGLEEIRKRYRDEDPLRFVDRFVFITGHKK
jgi:SAM-dependent methyltransferase